MIKPWRFQLPLLVLLATIHSALARVTLELIRDLTSTTNECRQRIIHPDGDGGTATVGIAKSEGMGLGGGQHGYQEIMYGGREEEDYGGVEDVVTAALRILCSDLLVELEKPLGSTSATQIHDCPKVVSEYHMFLEATVKFLREVQEKQMHWRWGSKSGVFEGMGWLQGLWASRSTNSQNRSFIEQQMGMYTATGCFGENQEVLKRDVEIVEYMNDLIDSFG